jgi:hypothetical protein
MRIRIDLIFGAVKAARRYNGNIVTLLYKAIVIVAKNPDFFEKSGF